MPEKQERSIGELFSALAGETATLIRQEVALAKVELTQKAGKAGSNVGSLAVGAALAYSALLCVLAGLINLLAGVMPWWAAALVVAVVVGGIGAAMASKALTALKQMNVAPQQTVETLKEDAQWAKDQVK